jgi:hypothetical protein
MRDTEPTCLRRVLVFLQIEFGTALNLYGFVARLADEFKVDFIDN